MAWSTFQLQNADCSQVWGSAQLEHMPWSMNTVSNSLLCKCWVILKVYPEGTVYKMSTVLQLAFGTRATTKKPCLSLLANNLLDTWHIPCLLLTPKYKENKERSAFTFPWVAMVENNVFFLYFGTLPVGSVFSGHGDHCHGCISYIFPFLFVKRLHYVEQLWYVATKIHVPENECPVSIPLWWIPSISLAWKPYIAAILIQGNTPHVSHNLLTVHTVTHLQECVCCFNPIRHDAELLFKTTSASHHPIQPAHWITITKTHQEKDPENENELEEVTKWFHLYLHSTRCTQNWNAAVLIKRRWNAFWPIPN